MRLMLLIAVLLSHMGAYAESTNSQLLSDLVFYPQRSAPAEVIAKHNSLLASEVNGVIHEIHVDVGDHVKKGEPLLRLNDYNYRQAVSQADAALQGLAAKIEFAQYQLDQARRLVKQNNISEELQRQRQAELTGLKAEQQSLKVELSVANYNLRQTVLRAPFDGVVIERQAQLGQLTRPGEPLFRFLSVVGQSVVADLPQNDAVRLHAVSDFQFQFGEQFFDLKLKNKVPMFHDRQRTQLVRFDFVGEAALVGSGGRLVWHDPRPHLAAEYFIQRKGQLGILILTEEGDEVFFALPHAQEGRATVVNPLSLDSQVLLHDKLN